MSLWSNLLETYDAVEKYTDDLVATDAIEIDKRLVPLYHTTLSTSICVVLDDEGRCKDIQVDDKAQTIIIPCTEESMGRTSQIAPHPLCDQIQYLDEHVDSKKGKERKEKYLNQLADWKGDDPVLQSIYEYVKNHSITEDAKILGVNISKNEKLGVRFSVYTRGGVNPHVEENIDIRERWTRYQRSRHDSDNLEKDMLGKPLSHTVQNFPKKIIAAAANAKLVSANDDKNFTFRGRFENKSEALVVDAESSQKIFNTLKWLVSNQGKIIDKQVIVVWSVQAPEKQIVLPMEDSEQISKNAMISELLRHVEMDSVEKVEEIVGRDYAKRFIRYLQGYGTTGHLQYDSDRTIVVILDSVTDGRLSTVFYRELLAHEYIESVLQWHVDLAWPLDRFEDGPRVHYVGAPSFTKIINCIYPTDDRTSDSYNRFARHLRKQLMESVFGSSHISYALLQRAFYKVTRPVAYKLDSKEGANRWNDDLEIACSLWKKYIIDENYRNSGTQLSQEEKNKMMVLDRERSDRDYLFGRMLAYADYFEREILSSRGKQDRSTNALLLMNNYISKPSSTWLSLWKKLTPYINGASGSRSIWFQNEIDNVIVKFNEGDFEDNTPLTATFLLGYSAQRRALRTKKESEDAQSTESF